MKKNLIFALLASIGLMGSAAAQTAPTFSGIALTPTTGLAFPLTYLTQESQPLTATIKNTYLGSTATISAVTSSDPQYVVTAETCTAAPLAKNGGSCTVTVKYVPTAVATASAAKINITRPTAGGNFWIPVTGIADTVPKVPTLPSATTFSGINQTPAQGLAFAELLPGLTSPSQTLTIKNTYLGSAITISAVASSDPQFVVTGETCTAAPLAKNGGTCTVDVAFKPAAAGTFAGKINFTRTSAGGNFFANLAGIGKGTTTPVTTGYTGASLTPTSLAFPDTAKGSSSAEQAVTVKNTFVGTTWKVNSVASNISSYKVTGNDCGTLAPGATCTIKVAFAPTLVQTLSGTITINRTVGTTTSNMIVKTTGNGTASASAPTVTLSATPSPLSFEATTVGSSLNKALTISNVSGSPVTVSTVTVSPAEFSVAGNTCAATPLAVGSNCTVTLKFSPTAEGTKTGTVTLTPSTGTPLVVSVNGSSLAETASAQLRAEPGVVVLPSTTVGNISSAITVTLTNTGGAPLTLGAVTSSPGGEFPITSACSAPLPPNGSCTVAISFKPSATGGRTGTLMITHNGVSSPSVIQLGGNGIAASDIYAEPVSVDFGSTVTGNASSAHTVTFYNAAATALDIKPLTLIGDITEFTQTNTCGTNLAAGATCTATALFKPTSSGAKRATLSMSSAADSKLVQAIDLTGTATLAQGVLMANPISVTFPSTMVGATSAAQTVTLTNTGTANVTVSQMAATTSDFSWTSNCGTLAPAATCTLSVKFNPATSGAKTATLNIANNGVGGTLGIPLSGAAATTPGAIVLSPTSVSFPDTALGLSSAVKTVALTNTGGSPVANPVVSVTSTDYLVTSNCGSSLAVGTSCTASLTFNPKATGTRTGNLSVNWTGATAPVTAGLTGNGVGVPAVTLSSSSLTFAATDVGQQSEGQSVTVTNSGTGNLAVSSVVLSSADFSQSNTCGTTVAPNGTCQVTVKLTPQTAGTKTGTLTLNHNAGSGSNTVGLSGTANTPMAKLATSVTNYTFPDTNLGASNAGTITLTNTGTAASALGAIVSDNTTDFPVTSTTCSTSLAAGASCTVTLKFAPSQAGSRSGTLTIPYGTGSATLSVALTGNGVNNAQITVSPPSLTFPSTTVGATSAAQTVTLTNSGSTPLVVSNVTAPSADFPMTQNCAASFAPGATCVISLRYAPTVIGSTSKNLTITSNAVNAASKTVPVTGSAVNPGVVSLSLNPVSLPQTVLGQTNTATVTLTNTGGSNLTVSSIAGATSELTVGNGCSGSVAPNGTCTLTLTFNPTTVGSKSGALTLTHTGQGGTTALNWTGVAVGAPAIVPSPSTVTFSNVSLGTPQTQTLTLTNTGGSPFMVSSLTLSNNTDYALVNDKCTQVSVPAAGVCVVDIQAKALALGATTATLAIASNASGTPPVTVAGTVSYPPPSTQLSTTGLDIMPAYVDGQQRVWLSPYAETAGCMVSYLPAGTWDWRLTDSPFIRTKMTPLNLAAPAGFYNPSAKASCSSQAQMVGTVMFTTATADYYFNSPHFAFDTATQSQVYWPAPTDASVFKLGNFAASATLTPNYPNWYFPGADYTYNPTQKYEPVAPPATRRVNHVALIGKVTFKYYNTNSKSYSETQMNRLASYMPDKTWQVLGDGTGRDTYCISGGFSSSALKFVLPSDSGHLRGFNLDAGGWGQEYSCDLQTGTTTTRYLNASAGGVKGIPSFISALTTVIKANDDVIYLNGKDVMRYVPSTATFSKVMTLDIAWTPTFVRMFEGGDGRIYLVEERSGRWYLHRLPASV